jgi:phenylacetate-coenzyme A ligase PaaK-like adenylate-forming protein
MKCALSRKNIWERMPPSAQTFVGSLLGACPPQFLLGRRFRRHLTFLQQAQWWSTEQAALYQLNELRRLCTLAYERTPYYRNVFAASGFTPRDLRTWEDIRGLPMIDRTIVRDHLHAMCAVPPNSPQVDYTSTGGTSGSPVRFYIGAERSPIEYAYLVSSWQRAGFRLGLPLAVFRGRPVRQDRTGFAHEYDPLLRHHYYSAFHMNDENMRRYLGHVRTIGPCFLHVYPSSVAALARFLRRGDVEPPSNIHGLIGESENVYPEQRRFVEDTFKRRFFSCYGLTEKVVAAAECEKSASYHVWPTYGLFELLDDRGRPVTTPGHRGEIVGTSFINRVVPFIRYRTGDYATYVATGCAECGRAHPIIVDIRGHRSQEALVAHDGAIITWTAINVHDDTFDNVLQFQLYQDTKGHAVLRLVPAPGFGDDDRQRIRRTLDRKLSGRLQVAFDIVESIPLSRSGKAIYVDQRLALDPFFDWDR